MVARFWGAVCALLLLVSAGAARADWHEASSDHFLIYADQNAEQVKRFAERLERYHSAMQFLLKREIAKPSPSNRVTVYVVSNQSQVRKLFGGDNQFVAGFYRPRAGGTVAVVPRIDSGASEWELSGETVLLHEYAHHVMWGTSSFTYPLWFSEGFAEFYGAASFEKDGSVGLGRQARHRAFELLAARNVPIELLLDTAAYRAHRAGSQGYDDFYGQSWLLFHYLTFSQERKGQMASFLNAILEGKGELESAKLAFGDLAKLDKDLAKYQQQRRMNYWQLLPTALKTSEIGVRKLSEAEAAIMPVRIRSRVGVDEATALELLPQARAVAAKFPSSDAVFDALAEAEFDAGNDDATIKAADAAIALNPNNINALIQKGYALARRAKDATEPKKAWADVRKQFQKANAIENDHPIPLIGYYESYAAGGEKPTMNALEGYAWAMELAPFDQELRLKVASALIDEKQYDAAAAALRPIINETHDEQVGAAAKELMALVQSKAAAAQQEAKLPPSQK